MLSGSKEIAAIDNINRWGYLDSIKEEVNVTYNIGVTLIIGSNCAKALEVHELIALKTLLGWYIVGPMYNQNRTEKLACDRTMVKSVVISLE